MTIENKLKKQMKILTDKGYTVAFVSIYGSQNYELDINNEEYKSDVDMKAVIVPTLDELVYNSKPISTTIETEWGQCDVKDIRVFFQTLVKANPAYIETLFTKHVVYNKNFMKDLHFVFNKAEELVYALRCQFIRAMYGMMCEKQKALTYPYPSIVHKIEKFGYDPKQAHHIYRIHLMMKEYFLDSKPLSQCFIPSTSEKEYLIDIKKGNFSLEEIKTLTDVWMTDAKQIKDEILSNIDETKIDYSIKDKYIEWSQNIIKEKIKKECIAEVISLCQN